ncbi:MAG: hypothetical protein EU544_01770 [Promethearchaeota archaeon]|nr:MAG: hypothetical protein EU544_01770 [Candidatus Lokiarchaeota archaeon]
MKNWWKISGWTMFIFLFLGTMLFAGISSDITKKDSKDTQYDNNDLRLSDTLIVTESANPIEVGDHEIFTAEIVDPHGVYNVEIEIDGWIRSMEQLDSTHWQYNWTAPSPDSYFYIVRYEDGMGREREANGTIEVLGDAPPQYSKLKILTNPLELGKNAKISLKVSDPEGVSQVLLEYEGLNHTFTDLGGEIYEYNEWTPSSVGYFPFRILMEDVNHNWNEYTDVLQVVLDASPPKYIMPEDDLDSVELGEDFEICITVLDAYGVNQVLIEYEGANHSMGNTPGTNSWCYGEWEPAKEGTYVYKIYMEDLYNNWNVTIASLKVITMTGSENTEENVKEEEEAFEGFLIIIIIIGAVSSLGGILAVKKSKGKEDDNRKNGMILNKKSKKTSDKYRKAVAKHPPIEKKQISVVCPICKTNFTIKVPKTVINKAKQLTTISIPKDVGCDHHFQMFVDKNFVPRGYQKVDYEFDPDEISEVELFKEENLNHNPKERQLDPIPLPEESKERIQKESKKRTKKSKKKDPVGKALIEVKEELKKETNEKEVKNAESGEIPKNFEDLESIYYEIRQLLSIPDENFDLFKLLNKTYESDKAKFQMLTTLLAFIQKFSMFNDIAPLMNSLYTHIRHSVEQKAKNIKDFEHQLVKTTLMGFIQDYLDYTHKEQKAEVLNFLTESLGKLDLEPMIVNLGLLLKPMYEDKEYLKNRDATQMEEITYVEEGEKEKLIKSALDKWIKRQPLTLENQAIINEQLIKEFDRVSQNYDVKKDSELYKTLTMDIKEMLALKLTVLSLMEGIADKSFEPVPLK